MTKITEMSDEELEEKDSKIRKIKTIEELLDWLSDDILNIVKDNTERFEIGELLRFYHKCMIDNFVDDDCSELALNIIVDPLKVKLWKQYEKDLFDAEFYLNSKLKVETRKGKAQDDFRSMKSICEDVAKVYGVEFDNKENK